MCWIPDSTSKSFPIPEPGFPNIGRQQCRTCTIVITSATGSLPQSKYLFWKRQAVFVKAVVMYNSKSHNRTGPIMALAASKTGAPNDCKHGLEFSIGLGRLKISRCPFHSCTIFEACLINFLRFSEIYFFTFHFPCWAIFRRKRKPKIFGFKNVTERGKYIKKNLTFLRR